MQVVLCKTSDVPEGTMRHFELMGYDVLVANASGRYFGLDAGCTYKWANLADGSLDLDRMVVTCKDCNGSWDLETGQPKDPPAQFPLTVYQVSEQDEDLYMEFTY